MRARVYSDLDNIAPCRDIAVDKGTATGAACKRRLTGLNRAAECRKESPANGNESETDGIEEIPSAPSKTRDLVAMRDIDSKIPVPSTPAKGGRRSFVGLEPDCIDVGSRASRYPDEIFLSIKMKNAESASRTAVLGTHDRAPVILHVD